MAAAAYRAINMESCERRPALRRAIVLASEREAVRAFEARMAATPLGFQLAVARGDALYALAAEHGCWSDSDPRFSRLHVQMARDQASAGLRRMEELAPALAASLPMMAMPAPDRAEFRYSLRSLIEATVAPCPISTRAENDEIMAPAREELRRFKHRLEGTPHAVHYALAEADVAYHWSITSVSCGDPGSGPPADVSRDALASIRRRIAAVEAGLVG